MLARRLVRFHRLRQDGDTIVEVLIAIVVVSAVLTGAFSIANLSLKSIRMAQERGEAQKIAQQSVELLNSFRPPNSGVTAQNAPFCIESGPGGSVPTAFELADVSNCASGAENRYRTSITRTTSGPVFKIRVVWDGIKGSQEQLEYYYQARSL